MRYAKDHKAETRARIVKSAAVQLREKGARGVGVADLMKEAGLTHGGFYAHFKSRDALVIEALGQAMDGSRQRWRDAAEQAPEGDGSRQRWRDAAEQAPEGEKFAALVNQYVTAKHRDDPGGGCTMAALGAEIVREGPKARKLFLAQLERMIAALSAQLPGSRGHAREQAIAALTSMVGSIVLSRVAGNGALSSDILDAGRNAALARGPAKPARKARAKKAKVTPS